MGGEGNLVKYNNTFVPPETCFAFIDWRLSFGSLHGFYRRFYIMTFTLGVFIGIHQDVSTVLAPVLLYSRFEDGNHCSESKFWPSTILF
jgi:hypothetical protein